MEVYKFLMEELFEKKIDMIALESTSDICKIKIWG